jgi:nucleoside 2-deoxyribosyltransferase
MMKRPTQSALALVAGAMADVFRAASDAAPAMKASLPHEPKIYFADNSRLWPEADAKIERSRVEALCRPRGFECVWPWEHFCFSGLSDVKANARVLPKAPFVYLRESAAIVAEVTPFRGVSLNPVIAFEMGIAVLLGLPVFAWTTAHDGHHPVPHDRMRRFLKGWPFQSLAARLVRGAPLSSFLIGAGRYHYWDMQGFRVEHSNMVESAVIAGNFTTLSTSVDEAIECCASHFARRAQTRAAPAAGDIVH